MALNNIYQAKKMKDQFLTRVTLLGNIKENKEEAWNEFCVFYWDIIIGWAKQLGCSDTVAKDVFQETIISLIRQLPNFTYDLDKGRFRSFIKTIVKRRVYDIYRKESKYVRITNHDDGTESDIASDIAAIDKMHYKGKVPDLAYDSDLVWIDSLLKKAIKLTAEKLDPKTYQSFKLYVLEEKPVEEVVQSTGIGQGTVYQHKSRFLSTLKKEFYKLINETSERGEVNIDKQGEKIFSQALAKVVEGRIDLKTTFLVSTPPEKLLNRLKIVKEIINELEENANAYKNALVVIENGKKNTYEISDSTTIGRAKASDIILDYDDVSTVHASILKDKNSNFTIMDTDSSNGTYLNGKRLEQTKKLISGDIIQIGANSAMVFIRN